MEKTALTKRPTMAAQKEMSDEVEHLKRLLRERNTRVQHLKVQCAESTDENKRLKRRTRALEKKIGIQKAMIASLEALTTIDQLTGVLNRRGLHDTMTRLLAEIHREISPGFVIVYIDFDLFKAINDLISHDVGDHVLQRFGRLALAAVRAVDYVGRLGGDEFVIILSDMTSRKDAEATIAKLLYMAQTTRFSGEVTRRQQRLFESQVGRKHFIEFTAGYAVVTKKDVNQPPAALIQRAEQNTPKFIERRHTKVPRRKKEQLAILFVQ